MKRLVALIPIAFLTACAPYSADERQGQPRVGSVTLENALLEYVRFEILPNVSGATVRGNITPLISNTFLYPAEGHLDLLVFNSSNKLVEKAAVRISSVVSPFTAAPRTRLWEWRYSVALKSSPSQISSMRFIYDTTPLDQ
jgi:hypothetical protein